MILLHFLWSIVAHAVQNAFYDWYSKPQLPFQSGRPRQWAYWQSIRRTSGKRGKYSYGLSTLWTIFDLSHNLRSRPQNKSYTMIKLFRWLYLTALEIFFNSIMEDMKQFIGSLSTHDSDSPSCSENDTNCQQTGHSIPYSLRSRVSFDIIYFLIHCSQNVWRYDIYLGSLNILWHIVQIKSSFAFFRVLVKVVELF